MSFWRRAKRFFSTGVDAIVGKHRVFGTDSECLDDGPSEVGHLLVSVAQIVREHLGIEGVTAAQAEHDDEWIVKFATTNGRTWKTTLAPRDYGPIFRLVNEALHDAGAPRRVHVVSRRNGGQNFYVACATTDDVADLLAAGWIVKCALPNAPHVIHHDGLSFYGHRSYHLSNRGSVIEATLAKQQSIDGLLCVEDNVVHLEYEGGLESAVLAEDVVLCGRFTISAGSRIAFWSAEKRIPSEVTLAKEHELDGIPCAAATTVCFGEDGSLLSLTLARAHRFDSDAGPYRGREIAAGSTLWFGEHGTIESIDDPTDGH